MSDLAAFVRRLTDEAFLEGNVDVIDELIAADFVDHDPVPGFEGRDGFKTLATILAAGFSPRRMTMDEFLVVDDRVVENWEMRGTHTGEVFGVPASGEEVTIRGIEIWRVTDRRITERWGVVDFNTNFLEQVGASHAP